MSPRRAPSPVFARLILPCALSIVLGCAEGPQTSVPDACDPFAPACPDDAVCALTDEGPRCRMPTPVPSGAACTASSCPAGQACATVEGLLRCRPLCAVADPETHPCPEGPICSYRLAGLDFGVCPARCAPGDDCGPSATCAISAALPYPLCVAIGSALAGEDCAERRCAEGLACLEVPLPDTPDVFVERCERLCDPRQPDSGRCAPDRCAGVVLGVAGVGYCVDDS